MSEKTEKAKFDVSKHLIRVQGNKEYLPVASRLIWFRQDHPDWNIVTEPVELDFDKQFAVFRTNIYAPDDAKPKATATKMENRQGFADWLEKAETGSLGRALAMIGYGTQFAPELDESERVVDSPQPAKSAARSGAPQSGYASNAATGKNNHPASGGTADAIPIGEDAAVTVYRCSVDGCGKTITKRCNDYSVATYGQPYCPQCQKQITAGN
jgi:hypothetical protein